MTALVSVYEENTQALPVTYVGGVTVSAYPTFWFYVPYTLHDMLTAEFVLQSGETEIYRVASNESAFGEFLVSDSLPGFVGITLPPQLAPLEAHTLYEWFFKVNCTAESPLFVQGGIQRATLAPALATQLATVSPQEQALLYETNELWYDAIATWGALWQANPTDPVIQAGWANLLTSLDLDDLSTVSPGN